MSTPFEFFRRHQKVALAAVTGSAILSFVVFDASSSNNLSPFGLSVLVIGCMALVGWIWGAGEGKSGENAIFGAVLGLAVSLVFMFLGRPPAAITAATGNITTQDLSELSRTRALANRMVNGVYYAGNPNAGFLAQFQLPQFLFGFGSQDGTSDLLISELLNREADELGIQITDDAVMNFLKQVAGKDADGDEQLTKKVFQDAVQGTRSQFQGTSEDGIINAIRFEMRARQAAQILLGGNRMTPADVWDLHKKLNTRESAQLVAIPVADFVDKSVEPSDADLKTFFDEYKGNYPNSTPEGVLAEGRPGLFLPRRVQLAYVEPVYEELEKQAGEITEEEIVKRYEERYVREMPTDDPHGGLNLPDLPFLPNVPEAPPAPATEAPAVPVGEKPAEEKPAAESPAVPAGEKPTEAPAPEAKPEVPAAEEKPAEPAPPADGAKPEGSSQRGRRSALQNVALIEDAPAAEKPAEAAPAAEAPAAPATEAAPATPAAESTPAAEVSAEAKPEETKPAETPADPTAEKPADAPLTVPPVDEPATDDDPAPPVSKVRPLDEVLRQEIRDQLLAEKTSPLVKAKVEAARDFMNDLHLGVSEYLDYQNSTDKKRPALSPDAITPEEANKRLKEYAEKNGLLYAETPLLSLDELLRSEDHPVGGAVAGRQGLVANAIAATNVKDLYSASTASDFSQRNSYAYWKIGDISAHEPKNMDEPGVKDAVVKAWRSFKARDKAEKRSKDLAEIVTKSGKPIAEALSEQTVTGGGKEKSVFVTVKSTGEFSWLRRSTAPNQFGGDNAPTMGAIQGVEGAGDSFMAKVFNEMKPGETAVVPNFDRSVYYIVQIEKRTPSTESEIEVMRKQFLESQGSLTQYANNMSRARDGNFADQLITKHGVKMNRSSEEGGN